VKSIIMKACIALTLCLLGAFNPRSIGEAEAAGAVVNTRKLVCSVPGVRCKTSNTPVPPKIPEFTPVLRTGLRIAPFECSGGTCPTPTGGAVRMLCDLSHVSFDDPIVFPGTPGATHQHFFFGNTTTNAFTTSESLMAATSTTCAGGTANKGAYWVPAVVDMFTKEPLMVISINLYYKGGTTKPPNGLRMVAGRNANAQGYEDETFYQIARFSCNGGLWQSTIPTDCPGGGEIWLDVGFPQCWDGLNLDSPNHRSHMTTIQGSPGDVCPSTHPLEISHIEFIARLQIPVGSNGSRLRLSSDNYPLSTPAGWSLHGDAWISWTEEIKDIWWTNCIVAGLDCHDNLLGDGTTLY
jgi:hypothetical protein